MSTALNYYGLNASVQSNLHNLLGFAASLEINLYELYASIVGLAFAIEHKGLTLLTKHGHVLGYVEAGTQNHASGLMLTGPQTTC